MHTQFTSQETRGNRRDTSGQTESEPTVRPRFVGTVGILLSSRLTVVPLSTDSCGNPLGSSKLIGLMPDSRSVAVTLDWVLMVVACVLVLLSIVTTFN
jgi:hypothetical protein